jgi:hypothetical protein
LRQMDATTRHRTPLARRAPLSPWGLLAFALPQVIAVAGQLRWARMAISTSAASCRASAMRVTPRLLRPRPQPLSELLLPSRLTLAALVEWLLSSMLYADFSRQCFPQYPFLEENTWLSVIILSQSGKITSKI